MTNKTVTFEDFYSDEGTKANRLIDLYEGRQIRYIKAALDGNTEGGYGRRANWLARGYVPHVRNIVKPIVEKSAMLFHNPPQYEILPDGNPEGIPVIDASFNQILMESDWTEFSRNLDIYTRLLKSVIVLQQKHIEDAEHRMTIDGMYIFDRDQGDAMVPILLHRGNSVAKTNVARTKIMELAYLTDGKYGDDEWEYQVITPDFIQDIVVKGGKEHPAQVKSNPDGIVPANFFYDAGKPRTGVWGRVPEDLPSYQFMYNVHLTDLAFALAVGKAQNLVVTNASFAKATNMTPNAAIATRVAETMDEGENRYIHRSMDDDNVLGGIGAVINLVPGRNSTLTPTADYKGPDAALVEHDAVMRQLIDDLASDWSVKMTVAGGSGESGFKVVVDHIDNLQLREQRAQSFQSAFRRFYKITCALYPELTAGSLQIIFAPPSLPVNQMEQQTLWDKKIKSGFKSVIDYFKEEEGLDASEAIRRAQEVKDENTLYVPEPVVPPGTTPFMKKP